MKNYVELLRIEQWLKNFIIFIPLFAYGEINTEDIVELILVFVFFSFVVSSTYVLNDILDLESDLNHPTKNKRPLASEKIPIKNAQFILIIFFCNWKNRSFLFGQHSVALFICLCIWDNKLLFSFQI